MKKIIEKIDELYYKLGKFRWLVPFALIFPFMKMSFFRIIMILTPIYDVFRWIFAALIILYVIFKKIKQTKLFYAAMIMEAWTIINVAIQVPNDLWGVTKDCLSIISVIFIIEIFLKDRKSLLNGLMLNFEISMYLELITMILYPHGIYTDSVIFLGLYTMLSLYLIPTYCVIVLYYKEFKTDRFISVIRPLCLFLCCIACTLIIPCATAKIATIGTIGVIFIGVLMKKKNFKIKLWPLAILTVFLGLFVVFIDEPGTFPLLDNIFTNVFGKNSTFSGRTPIWNASVEAIKEKPLIGYGFGANVFTIDDGWNRAHSEILQRLLADGIPGLLTFIGFNVVYINKVDKLKNDIYRILFVGISFAMYITYCMEAYTNLYIYFFIMFLVYHYEEFDSNNINDSL